MSDSSTSSMTWFARWLKLNFISRVGWMQSWPRLFHEATLPVQKKSQRFLVMVSVSEAFSWSPFRRPTIPFQVIVVATLQHSWTPFQGVNIFGSSEGRPPSRRAPVTFVTDIVRNRVPCWGTAVWFKCTHLSSMTVCPNSFLYAWLRSIKSCRTFKTSPTTLPIC